MAAPLAIAGRVLADLPIQYGDVAAWQRDELDAGRYAGQLAYWTRQLADLPPARWLWLLPLLMLAPALLAAKRQARLAYAALVGEHGRMVHRRWILREPVADPTLLEAAEIGPVAGSITAPPWPSCRGTVTGCG